VEDLSRDEGLFAVFDLKHDFSGEWYKTMQPVTDATERLLNLNNLFERLPIFTKSRKADKIQAVDIALYIPAAAAVSELRLIPGTEDVPFVEGPPLGTMNSFVIKSDEGFPMNSWQLKLKVQGGNIELDKFWLLVRYVLK
jgi:hypothetical protein